MALDQTCNENTLECADGLICSHKNTCLHKCSISSDCKDGLKCVLSSCNVQ